VFCVVPRVLLQGDEGRIESLTSMQWRDGFARFDQPFASGGEERPPFRPIAVAFAVGGTCLFRRDDFLAKGGFDELFEPFYWEDIDLCWRAWRDGRRSLYQPASVVEHQHRGTIGEIVDEELVRAALAKNGYLFQWRHLDAASLRVHLASLYRLLIDAWQRDEREPLVHLNLALEQLPELLRAREALGEPRLGFREILERIEVDA
jgi:GT2 family glycosyltransferase